MSPLLTVIVPTYNRPADLMRTVKFLRHRSLALSIIIADGSDSEYSFQNSRCRELGEDIGYFHVPPGTHGSLGDELPQSRPTGT